MIAPHAGHELTHAHLDGTSDNIVEDLVLDLPSQITAEKIRLQGSFSHDKDWAFNHPPAKALKLNLSLVKYMLTL